MLSRWIYYETVCTINGCHTRQRLPFIPYFNAVWMSVHFLHKRFQSSEAIFTSSACSDQEPTMCKGRYYESYKCFCTKKTWRKSIHSELWRTVPLFGHGTMELVKRPARGNTSLLKSNIH